MSSTATTLGTRLGARLGTSVGVEGDPNLNTILAILAAQSMSVWFDPAWDDGVTLVNDAGTDRITAILSRPISGQTQYTVSQASTPLGPAAIDSPNGKRVMSFAGTQYLQGAGALATLLQGSAGYSELQVGSRAVGASIGRWSAGLVAASPDNRIVHYLSGATGLTIRFRTAAGASTSNSGAVTTLNDPYVYSSTYSGSDYDGWLDGAPETLTGGGANVRAPATLDTLAIGVIWASGAPANFWTGMQGGLLITSQLSTPDRQAIEIAVGAYYGYPL